MHSFSRRNDPHVAVHAYRLIASADIGVKYPTRTLALDSIGDRKVLRESDGVLSILPQEADAVARRAYDGSSYSRAVGTRLEPIKNMPLMLKTRSDRVLIRFSPISTAPAEGFDSRIEEIKSAAGGFCNFEHC